MPEILYESEGIADSINAGGLVAAPGSGAAIVTINAASIPAGVYQIKVRTSQGPAATLAVGDIGNFAIKKGGASVIFGGIPANTEITINRVTFDGASNLTVNTAAAATASTQYGAAVTLTRIQ